MSTEQGTKRSPSPIGGSESKKQNTGEASAAPKSQHDHFAKGIAPIKAEYIITDKVVDTSYNLDDEEGGREFEPEAGEQKSKHKKRGQNKNRDLKQPHDEVRLCSTLLDPSNPKECKFGAKGCRNCHDLEEYFKSKPEDIDGICPVYNAIGYCPTGLKCRWLGSHYNKELNQLSKDLGKLEKAKLDNYEVNKILGENKTLLQKKKYEFEYATQYIPYLDSLVLNEENIQRQKDNNNEYTEAPFKVAEKKKINLHRAKIVSPLTTVGNLPYRRLMKTLGADVTYSEMALSLPLIQGTNAEWALPKAHISEYPGYGVQIAASKHWQAAKAADAIQKNTSHVSEINLNCGCPIDLLYRQGQGSALMDQPSKLLRILKGMNACSGDIPVTVKLRTGTKDNHPNAKNLITRIMNENDIAAITLHGRSRQQRYTKEANWEYIGEVGSIVKELNEKKKDNKELTDTQPTYFVGNGDCYSFEDWYKAVETPGIDSVMIARGALIKPWIFQEIEAQQYLDKSSTERLELLRIYANFAIEHWGSDEYGVGLSRRFLCEFMSFFHRYVPVGILERLPPKLNERPPQWRGRDDLETLLGSTDYRDWIKITEMFLGKANKNFQYTPKHKSNSYETK